MTPPLFAATPLAGSRTIARRFAARIACRVAASVALVLALCVFAHPGVAQSSDVLSRDAVLRDADIPAGGNVDGDITIVEYVDFQCPSCKQTHPELLQAVREDGGVRLVFKDWPIFGGVSVYAAKMTLAAKFQNKFAEAHEALITTKARLTESSVRKTLAEAGINVARATKDLETNRDAIQAILRRNSDQAEAFGFRGTPAFIIGTFRVSTALNAANFHHAIDDARAARSGPDQKNKPE